MCSESPSLTDRLDRQMFYWKWKAAVNVVCIDVDVTPATDTCPIVSHRLCRGVLELENEIMALGIGIAHRGAGDRRRGNSLPVCQWTIQVPYRSGLALDPPRKRGAQHFQKTPADHYRVWRGVREHVLVQSTRLAASPSCGGPVGRAMGDSGGRGDVVRAHGEPPSDRLPSRKA
jgi:hypothetical protein